MLNYVFGAMKKFVKRNNLRQVNITPIKLERSEFGFINPLGCP